MPIHPDVLVVGGGIAGIHAALTLANAGKKVYLVEREPSIGGHMAKFDKTFPTLDCAACILTPKMSAVGSHPNITLWSYSEVTKVDGYVGNYTVTVKRKPRYVNEDLCTGCQECIANCVYKEPKFLDEFNEGLGKRKPIYIPFPQATPQVVLIDPEVCLNFKRGVLTDKCKKTCVEACGEKKAIDFTQKEELKEIKVGTIIVATGFKTFDAKRIPQYGYGTYPERLYLAGGRAPGQRLRPDRRRGDPARRQAAESHRHHPLRRLARQEDQPLVLARLLHVFPEAGASAQGAHRGRDLQLLHRHAHARQGLRGVLRQAARRRRPVHPRPRRRSHRLGHDAGGGRQAGHPRRGHAGRLRPPHPGGYGGAGHGPGAAGGRAGRAAHVQHELRLAKASSWSGTRSWPR